LLKNGSWYLNGNENVPVTWNAGDNNSQHKITPVECDPAIQSVGDYTTVTAENLMDGQLVALYNNGRNYYIAEENGAYVAKTDAPTAQSFNYVFRVGKNADGTFTFTSISGAIPTLPYNTTFAPGNTAENFTLTSAGTGLFYLQGATAVASEGGKQERQYLNGSATAPIGWNAAGANSTYRFYPIKMASSAPSISISSPTSVQTFKPIQFKLTGDADIASCVWTIDGKTYTTTSPTVTFTTTGSQTVECTAVNMRGLSTTAKKTITVNAAPEISADFTVSKENIAGGEKVSFIATNEVAGCTYHWDLPGTQELTANTRNVSIVYLETGDHQVTLTVTAPDGTKVTKTQTVTVSLVAPAPAFDQSEAVIMKGESVSFTDHTLYQPKAWSWTLLEEKNTRYQSHDQNPTFTPAPGRYTLTLTASNEKGSTTVTRKNAVLVCNAPSYTGLEFAGGNNRVTTNLPEKITTEWTIDFWLNPSELSEACVGIFGTNLSITSNADGAVTLKRGSTNLATSANTFYVAGEWHHYAITFGGGSVMFYRDGVEFSRSARSSINFSTNFTTLQIGGENAPLQGMIDEFRIWAKALSISKIRSYAVAPIEDVAAAVQNDALLLYYQFNQNSGDCEDATSYGNTGTRHDFGPDGDAWSESRGVFAINMEGGSALGGMLSQNYFRVINVSDEDGSNLASNIIDGKDDTQWSSSAEAYPHTLTLDRGKLDEIYAVKFYSANGSDMATLPSTVTIYESDDASTWTPILTDAHLAFSGNFSEVVLDNPTTKRYLKFEFPTGGTNFALNEIFFFGKEGEVFDNQTDITSQTGHTVTWRIYDKTGKELWKIFKQTDVEQGKKFTSLPTAYRINGCTYSSVSATVDGDITIDVKCTWSMFTPSTPANPVYHNLKVNNKYARWDVATGKVTLNATKPAASEESGKWAFFGNPYAGYLMVNAAEPWKFLACQTANQSYATLDAMGTRFSSSKSSSSNGGFLLQVNQNVSYLNDFSNAGLLATWADAKAVSGAGSAFTATVVSGGTNGIETIDNSQLTIDNENWYTIDGMKLNGKPTAKGIYIVNGRKVVIK
ncbi:MAG: discoidin domain-containing protein, partial [Prevotella sp.]|nr:discoidin domain-containing protein [Prevotella sp.]